MKRGAPRHPKVSELARELNIPIYSAVGLLELLWHFTAEFALPGDIGRFSDTAIAKAIHWDGDSFRLIEALTKQCWIDLCQCHRIRVHDWPHHADQTVHRVLANRNQSFLKCYDDASIILAASYDHNSLPSPSPYPFPNPNPLPPSQGVLIAEAVKKVECPVNGHEALKAEHAIMNECETVYSVYPRKVGKPHAMKAIRTQIHKFGYDLVLKATQGFAEAWACDRKSKFIPHPATWFNQERFNDDPSTWNARNNSTQSTTVW